MAGEEEERLFSLKRAASAETGQLSSFTAVCGFQALPVESPWRYRPLSLTLCKMSEGKKPHAQTQPVGGGQSDSDH